ERVTLLPDGLTEIGDGDGKSLYGFVPLDSENRRFVAWFRKDEETVQDHVQLYMLLERRSADEFVLYVPECNGELAEIARKAGADRGLRLVRARVQRRLLQAQRAWTHGARGAQARVGRARAARQRCQLREATIGEAHPCADDRARVAEFGRRAVAGAAQDRRRQFHAARYRCAGAGV